jgi:hypothetical protein
MASVTRRNYKWLAIDHKAHVAYEPLVENSVKHVTVVNCALGFADHTGARRRR